MGDRIFDILEDQVVPFCHCTVCGVELDINEDSPIGFVCGKCWIDCCDGLYDILPTLKDEPKEKIA